MFRLEGGGAGHDLDERSPLRRRPSPRRRVRGLRLASFEGSGLARATAAGAAVSDVRDHGRDLSSLLLESLPRQPVFFVFVRACYDLDRGPAGSVAREMVMTTLTRSCPSVRSAQDARLLGRAGTSKLRDYLPVLVRRPSKVDDDEHLRARGLEDVPDRFTSLRGAAHRREMSFPPRAGLSGQAAVTILVAPLRGQSLGHDRRAARTRRRGWPALDERNSASCLTSTPDDVPWGGGVGVSR